MNDKKESINKHASIMNRIGYQYFDETLESFQIGGGQQFFLLHINYAPGINQLELSNVGNFHKGTTARAVQKLEELGYIIRVESQKDKRMNQLYITEKAKPLIKEIETMLLKWNEIITKGLTEEEIETTKTIMKQMAKNAIEHREQQKLKKKENLL